MKLPATAVIFCGGRSVRMGRDKALLDWHGRPLAAHVASRIAPLFERVVISGNPGLYGKLGYPCVADRGGAGPLAGLCAVLMETRHAAVFAVACDMPLVDPGAVRVLWDRLRGHDGAVPLAGHGPEPLHAFYCRRVLPAAARELGGKGRVTGWWGECDVRRVPAPELPGGEAALADCDTAGEFARMSSAK